MQLHSCLVPVGILSGLAAGWVVGEATHSAEIGAWTGVVVNLMVGGSKNVLMVDFLALLTARPASAFANFLAVSSMLAKYAT